jgi:uncharacterized protein (TIGR00369 family)
MTAQDRTRTYSWQDPLATAQSGRALAGLDFLRKIVAGELPPPPIAHTLDYTLLEVEQGRAVFGIEPAEIHYNPIGMVHGGIPCTLLDSAMGCAVHSTLPAGVGYTTLELKVNIVKAIGKDTGFLRAEGKLIHAGRSTAVAEGRLVDAAGKLYAHATTTCLILRA